MVHPQGPHQNVTSTGLFSEKAINAPNPQGISPDGGTEVVPTLQPITPHRLHCDSESLRQSAQIYSPLCETREFDVPHFVRSYGTPCASHCE